MIARRSFTALGRPSVVTDICQHYPESKVSVVLFVCFSQRNLENYDLRLIICRWKLKYGACRAQCNCPKDVRVNIENGV